MKIGKILVGGITYVVVLAGLVFAGPAVETADEGTVFSVATFRIVPGQRRATPPASMMVQPRRC